MTSGRRTAEGNRMVGGVPGSHHVNGNAADYAGGNLQSLLSDVQNYYGRYGHAAIHKGNHVHVDLPDYQVPYYGNRGTYGLGR